mmetsp:Transcript_49552/g.107788  ORF Transcript_49552/g.107788 Transcript_49552/m.107788 type:complete len:125 (+) Transcript_49552:2537-2911(+)
MSLGVSVDYSAHIMLMFLESGRDTSKSREQRVRETLVGIGPAVLHAGLSTFLGISFTFLGTTFIWEAFSRIWTTIILSGLWFSLVALPSFLGFPYLCGWEGHSMGQDNTLDKKDYKNKNKNKYE